MAFNRAVQSLPAGALPHRAGTRVLDHRGLPALMTSEFSNCVLIGSGDTIFADGFD
jgi:hypothetical protein